MGIVEKIQEIEREIGRTQKNKATEYHLGVLKAKLAKYRQELLEPSQKGGGGKGEGFDVMKSGDARVALVGFPSVGKSTFLSTVTTTESVAASYEFTTLTCIPGVIEYGGANIQLLDLPGIIEGASQGKGRGRQVIAVAKTADLILMMLDATKGDIQKKLLEKELEEVGIRLNKKRPNIYFKKKPGGGIKFTHTVALTHCDEKMISNILHEYKIFNADIIFRENSNVDELIDVIQGNRVYIPCLYVYNKIDQISLEEMDRLARMSPHNVVISCELNLNLDYMLQRIWEYLALKRVYTKKPGNPPDLVALVGFPSVGKSTFLSTVTTTESVAASYEFTTLTCIPGVIEYGGANIQLLDLPGIIEGASQGKGRGRQVIAVAKTADLILMMLDATKGDIQKKLLEKELEEVGIRLNKKRPNIYFKKKPGGGIKFTHTVALTHCDEKMISNILHEYKIFNADIIFRENSNVDELIDVIQGNRVYIPCLYVYNKIDQISLEEMDRLARMSPHNVVISCELNLNLDYMLQRIWEYLALKRVYTKKPGNPPDLGPSDGIILRSSATVEHACHALHRTLAQAFRYAIVWGTSTKFSPQRVGITHKLAHEDVIQIVKKN